MTTTVLIYFRRLGCLIVFLTFGSNIVIADPTTWEVDDGGNGHEYEVISTSSGTFTWAAARTAAQAIGTGWELASITSQAEQSFIITLLPLTPSDREHIWIGGTDFITENTFEWSDGETFGFTSWWDEEPNNRGEEDYIALDYREDKGGWDWNDVPLNGAGLITHYVVENSKTSLFVIPKYRIVTAGWEWFSTLLTFSIGTPSVNMT